MALDRAEVTVGAAHPGLASAAYAHPSLAAYGAITVGEGSSLWPNVVIRAEVYEVRIGRFTNIQDFTMLHVGSSSPTIIGDFCSITHHVTAHGCTIEDDCLIGINATLMDGVVVGRGSIVAGHSFVREGTIIPPNCVVMGVPAKVVRERDSSRANIVNALMYHRNALAYRAGEHRAWENVDMAGVEAEADSILQARTR